MSYSPVLIFHIFAAVITWPAGMAALLFRKGSYLHRTSGNVFFVSMLSMSASGAYIAVAKAQALNVVAGALTFYLVATGWSAVRRKSKEAGLFELGALVVSLAVGVGGMIVGWQAAILKDSMPAPYFVFGSIALLAAASDISVLARGGISGAQRIARHLWRMCVALLIDTMSLFLGKQQHFPDVIRATHLLNVPIAVVAVLTVYWLIRVLFTSAYRRKTVTRKADVYAVSA